MNTKTIHRGSCFCGAVEITVTGEPAAAGYCHCGSCRTWSAGPVNAFTLWPFEAVKVVKGAEKVGVYNKSPLSYRKFCTTCGGHVFIEHPTWKVIDVPAVILRELAFQPGLHVNYASTVLRMKDGLPKMADFPAEMGGSGQTLAE